MNLINPFPVVEHKVYSHTFLRDVELIFRFDQVEGERNEQLIKEFVAEHYNVDIPDNVDAPSPFLSFQLTSEDQRVVCNFAEKMVSVKFKENSYYSYDQSLKNFIFIFKDYLQKVCRVSQLKTLTIRKVNLWSISPDLSLSVKDIYESALHHTFKEEYVKNLAFKEWPKEKTFRLTSESKRNIGDGDFNDVLSAFIKDDCSLDFNLDCVANANNVPFDEIDNAVDQLNFICYCAYHEIVSKDVIDMMA